MTHNYYTLHAECKPFYSVIFSLSLSTVVHYTRAEYHNNSYSHEKTRRCNRYAGAQFNTAVIIPAVYFIKNDLVASKKIVNKEQYTKNEVK